MTVRTVITLVLPCSQLATPPAVSYEHAKGFLASTDRRAECPDGLLRIIKFWGTEMANIQHLRYSIACVREEVSNVSVHGRV